MQIVKKIRLFTEEEAGGDEVLLLSYRSQPPASVNTGTLCATEVIDTAFFIYSSTSPVITTGDVAYNTNNLSSPLNGENKYFKVAFASALETENYIAQISPLGVITITNTCSM